MLLNNIKKLLGDKIYNFFKNFLEKVLKVYKFFCKFLAYSSALTFVFYAIFIQLSNLWVIYNEYNDEYKWISSYIYLDNLTSFDFFDVYKYVFSWNYLYIFKKLEFTPDLFSKVWDSVSIYETGFESMLTSYESQFQFNWSLIEVNQFEYYWESKTKVENFIYYIPYKLIYIIIDFYHFLINFELNSPLFFYFGSLFLMSTLISLILMSYLGLYGVFFINLITIILFWLSTVYYINDFFYTNNFYKLNVGKWFTVALVNDVYFEFFIDSISYSFMLLTVTIATFVYIYIFSYFRYDANVERLTIFINLFVISMVILVTSGNFFVMFLGWELIGLTSFFLINFWSTRISTVKSAFKAFAFNKFSDVSLFIGVVLCFLLTSDINILSFNKQIHQYLGFYISIFDYDVHLIELISFFFIIAAFIKSAQFGAHIWLPDSMEAPVPASALIHSATLVSAGVFILLRLTPLFELSYYSFFIIPVIGSFTAFFGGLCAAYQADIKRILAYSTISHCGFLMVCYSTFVPEFTILYLYIHGFFKAAVFLCAGNIIRFSRNYQDFRRMGGYWKYLPFECFSSFVCLINLCGLPFSIGFYIKHLILIGVYYNYFLINFIFVNIFGGAVFGLIYSYKFFYYVFFDIKKSKKIIYISSNRRVLKSKFYSNTTLAANISISSLIIISYSVSIFLLNSFLNKNSIGEGLDIYSSYSSLYSEFNTPTRSLLINIGFFNWLLLFIIFIIIFTSWRVVYNNFIFLKVLSFFISFFTLFIFFLI